MPSSGLWSITQILPKSTRFPPQAHHNCVASGSSTMQSNHCSYLNCMAGIPRQQVLISNVIDHLCTLAKSLLNHAACHVDGFTFTAEDDIRVVRRDSQPFGSRQDSSCCLNDTIVFKMVPSKRDYLFNAGSWYAINAKSAAMNDLLVPSLLIWKGGAIFSRACIVM